MQGVRAWVFIRKDLITNSWKVVSTDTSIGNHSRICEMGIYFSHDNKSHSAKSADMKRIGASISMNNKGKIRQNMDIVKQITPEPGRQSYEIQWGTINK